MTRHRVGARGTLVAATLVAGTAALAATAAAGTQPQPAAATGAGSDSGNAAPVVVLRVEHRRFRAGKRIVLDASRSRDPDGRIAHYLWDLDGDGIFERDTGTRPRVRHAFRRARRVRVAVVAVDDAGAYAEKRLRLRAVGRDRAGRGGGARRAHRSGGRGHSGQRLRSATRAIDGHRSARRGHAKATPHARLHTAASKSSSVTVSDFKFTPASITVHVGDTVTWTNNGPAGHSATANNGDFDTGVLAKGQTGQFRFDKPGTFGYHCVPHPYMKASVKVIGSGGSTVAPTSATPSSSPSGGSSGSGSGGGKSSSKGSSLPHTGLEIGLVLAAGLALLGAGTALRRRLARP